MKTATERGGEFRALVENKTIEFNSCIPATVTAIDGNFVSVQPYIRKPRMNDDGSWAYEKTEVIDQIPVAMPSCGEFSINMPISVGCQGTLWFVDYDIDNWVLGNGDVPHTARTHDQNDAIWQPAFNGTQIGGECMTLKSSSVTVKICPDGFDVEYNGESMVDSINNAMIACRCSPPLSGWKP